MLRQGKTAFYNEAMTSERSTRRANVALLGAAVLFGLLLAEAVVRLLRPQFVDPWWRSRLSYYRHDSDLGWSHIPGAVGVLARQEFSHEVRINSSGWRDRERTLDKPPGILRVVVLGDSFAFGHGVRDEEIFTRLMEPMLNQVKQGTEVLNMALSGSSTDQQLLILRRLAMAWKPDIVLVMVCRNDFTGILATTDGPYGKPAFTLERDGSLRLVNVPVPQVPWTARLHAWVRRTSGLVNLLETWLKHDEPGADPSAPSGTAARETSYALMRALLSEMRRVAEQGGADRGGARLVVGLVPSNAHTYFDEVPAAEQRRFGVVTAFGAAENVPVIDLVPVFRRAARDPVTGARIDLHYRLDQHWNKLGHQIAAAEIARRLAALP